MKARGTEGAFEALRYVFSKGKKRECDTTKRQGPRKALNPEQAKHTNKVETNEGKGEFEITQFMTTSRQQTLVRILPEAMAVYVIKWYVVEDGFDEMETAVDSGGSKRTILNGLFSTTGKKTTGTSAQHLQHRITQQFKKTRVKITR